MMLRWNTCVKVNNFIKFYMSLFCEVIVYISMYMYIFCWHKYMLLHTTQSDIIFLFCVLSMCMCECVVLQYKFSFYFLSLSSYVYLPCFATILQIIEQICIATTLLLLLLAYFNINKKCYVIS